MTVGSNHLQKVASRGKANGLSIVVLAKLPSSDGDAVNVGYVLDETFSELMFSGEDDAVVRWRCRHQVLDESLSASKYSSEDARCRHQMEMPSSDGVAVFRLLCWMHV